MKKIIITILICVCVWPTSQLLAQLAFTVSNTLDAGPGSFRQALLDANINISIIPDTIRFNIAGNGVHSIAPNSALPVITNPIFIDGLSQAGASNNAWPPNLLIELEGSQLGAGAEGLVFATNKSIIRGLVINRFDLNGVRFAGVGGNKVQTCFIGTNVDGTMDLGNGRNGIYIQNSSNNTIGGNSYQQRNLISGNDLTAITINGADAKSNKVSGNYIGTDALGLNALGNGGLAGVWTDLYRTVYLINGASKNVIGGPAEERNVISGNLGHGVFVTGLNNRVENNYIGVDATGGGALGNAFSGVVVYAGFQNYIGGTSQGLGNVISANGIAGITLTSYSTPAQSNIVYHNIIGLSAGGTPIGNVDGIVLSMNATYNDIVANTIAGNTGKGIVMTGNGVFNNELRFNKIYQNQGIGIDLGGDGISLNDTGDGDGGSNLTQNFPVISSVYINTNGKIKIIGTFNSIPNQDFLLEFFASGMCNSNSSGLDYGEGQHLLGDYTVTTDATGNASFEQEFSGRQAPGRFITATARDVNGNTSEFSQCAYIPNWSTLGVGVNGTVRAMAIDNSGIVFIGGDFTLSGNDTLNYLAKWTGTKWEMVGNGANAPVHALHFDTQGNLYVGGEFTQVGNGVIANRIAQWDGINWSTFGLGMNNTVKTIATSTTGTLYAGGIFTAADGNNQIKGIARWNTTQWVGMGTAVTHCYAIVVAPNTEVYAGGHIDLPGYTASENVAKWNGASWSALGSGVNSTVHALALDTQNRPFIGGSFNFSNIINVLFYTGAWDGNAWQRLGQSVDDIVYDLTFDNQGNLYAGGRYFDLRNGQIGNGLGQWNGNDWSPIGGGVYYGEGTAYTIAIHGNYLYVGGNFLEANGVPSQNIARFWINYIGQEKTIIPPLNLLDNTIHTDPELHVFPNPFRDKLTLQFSLSEKSRVNLEIYDLNGRLVQTLVQEEKVNGDYTVNWNGLGREGRSVSPGIYICTLRVGERVINEKIVLVD